MTDLPTLKIGDLIEELSELEHQQWEKWSKDLSSQLQHIYNCIENGDLKQAKAVLTKRIRKWKMNWKPYSELDEPTKELDRKWARNVAALVEAEFVKLVKAYAAAYQKKAFPIGKDGSGLFIREDGKVRPFQYFEGAHDAVLKLLPKELKRNGRLRENGSV